MTRCEKCGSTNFYTTLKTTSTDMVVVDGECELIREPDPLIDVDAPDLNDADEIYIEGPFYCADCGEEFEEIDGCDQEVSSEVYATILGEKVADRRGKDSITVITGYDKKKEEEAEEKFESMEGELFEI
jgi:hypothetical protein